jgi:hypothetical protein
MSFSAKAGAHRSRPIFTSHSAIGCTSVVHLGVTEVRASQTEMILMGLSHLAEVSGYDKSAIAAFDKSHEHRLSDLGNEARFHLRPSLGLMTVPRPAPE